ncbi:MAG: glutamyl-Q tRNA(Asp) synthetase [Gammaproteobacteria bacterium]|jgi:glutamyl-Q tRNA(Asp) synthetase
MMHAVGRHAGVRPESNNAGIGAQTSAARYVGRFAPSPTGPLHFGSIVAAIGSWLDARAVGGAWHVRLDDLDGPRNEAGADRRIADELRRLGLEWDGVLTRQSEHPERYRDALERLKACGATFACGCSRKDLIAGVYPGTCRFGLAAGVTARSTRLRLRDQRIEFEDLVQGQYAQDLQTSIGDFVLLRADGIVAYHLATVLDDALAGITHVIRGCDLLESTPRQIALQRALGVPTPTYGHLPLVLNPDGQKLSKQTRATSTEDQPPTLVWRAALHFLGYRATESLRDAGLKEIQRWAITRWSVSRLPSAARVIDAGLQNDPAYAHGGRTLADDG